MTECCRVVFAARLLVSALETYLPAAGRQGYQVTGATPGVRSV
jgi:hypothetical protein